MGAQDEYLRNFCILRTDRGIIPLTDPLQIAIFDKLQGKMRRPIDLSTELGMSSSSLHFIIDKMEEAGIVNRIKPESDKKSVYYISNAIALARSVEVPKEVSESAAACCEELMEGEESKPIISETRETLGLMQRTVCPVSGKLSTDACVHYQDLNKKFRLVTDWFSYATVPTEPCDMHVTLSICKRSGCVAGAACDPDDIAERTFVLLRPGNPFYDLDDDVLKKIFSDTWVRTEKSISQYIAEFPVCSTDTSFESLKERGDRLIAMTETFLDAHPEVSEKNRSQLTELTRVLSGETEFDAYKAAYESLLSEYNRLVAEYGG